jgi:hypothetical protein
MWHRYHRFEAMISVSGRRLPPGWTLSFTMPGSQITNVYGANWQLSAGGDGVTASAGWNEGSDFGHDSYGINFTITGTGAARLPTGCVFDGISCAFSSSNATSRMHD